MQFVQLLGRSWVFFVSHTAPGFQLWFYFHLCIWVIHWGLLLRLPWRTWVCRGEGQVWRWCSCLGRRGSGSASYLGELTDRAAGNTEGYGNQYWPIHFCILAWRTPLTQKLGRPQSTGSQISGHDWGNPAFIGARLLFPVAALPQWAWRRGSCLACGDAGGAKCAGTQTSSTIGIMALSVIFWASCSWWSEFLFGQSFSTALPIQALRGLPCLESISIAQCVRHIEGSLWLRSYSVDQCIRHLKGHAGWGLTL